MIMVVGPAIMGLMYVSQDQASLLWSVYLKDFDPLSQLIRAETDGLVLEMMQS